MSVPSERNSFYWFPQNIFIILVRGFASFTKFWKFVAMTIYFIDPFFLFFYMYLSYLSSLSLYHSDTLESPNSFLLCRADHFLTTSVIELKKKKDAKALPCKGPAVKNFCVCWNVCGSSGQSYLSSNYKHNTTTSQVIYKHTWRKSLFSFLIFIFICPSIHFTPFSLPGLKLY